MFFSRGWNGILLFCCFNKKETKQTLIARCKELGINGYSGKTKLQLVELLKANKKPESLSNESHPLIPEEKNVAEKEESTENTSTSLKFVDLFCGIGGFHQALNRIGATCVFACDIDEQCRKTYETNYGLKPHGDISKLEISQNIIPEFDILCAVFPCQSFSKNYFQY